MIGKAPHIDGIHVDILLTNLIFTTVGLKVLYTVGTYEFVQLHFCMVCLHPTEGLGMGLGWSMHASSKSYKSYIFKQISTKLPVKHYFQIRLLYLFLQVSQKFRLHALIFSVDFGNGKIFMVNFSQ